MITRAPPSTSTERIPPRRRALIAASRSTPFGPAGTTRTDTPRRAELGSALRRGGARRDDDGRGVIGQHPGIVRGPESRVEDDPDRRGPRHQSNRQLRIVPHDGPDADEHRVARGAERVRGPALRLPADPPRVAGRGRDPTVERLGVLHDDVRAGRRGADISQERADVGWRPHPVRQRRAPRGDVPHHGLLGREVPDVARVRRRREADDGPDRDPRGLEGGRLVAVVGHQPDRPDAQRSQALRDVAEGPLVDVEAQMLVRLRGVEPRVLQHVRPELVRQADPAALVPRRVDEHAAALGGDRAERVPELDPAVAPQRAERVARQALRVHPDQDVLAVADPAPAQAHVDGVGPLERADVPLAERRGQGEARDLPGDGHGAGHGSPVPISPGSQSPPRLTWDSCG